ncbi:MAG: DMT family transporter [Clostridia bacterium]|nr:DMT family transporter [Clostridia bacterium]
MQKNNFKGTLILLLTSLIWGFAFVAQTKASKSIPPFAFNAVRSFIGAFCLFSYLFVKRWVSGEKILSKTKQMRKDTAVAAILCGVMLCIAANLQQAGITAYPKNVSASARAGFITALYVIIVPILSLFSKRKPPLIIFFAAAAAAIGVYLLCNNGKMGGLYLGDILMLLCALAFSLHILTVDRFGYKTDGIKLSAYQFLICGTLSAVISLIFEKGGLSFSAIISSFWAIMYVGILSSGVAYTLQIVGQKYAEPSIASIAMSFESVFAAIGGILFGEKMLSLKEAGGCLLMFIAIIAAQLPDVVKVKKSRS